MYFPYQLFLFLLIASINFHCKTNVSSQAKSLTSTEQNHSEITEDKCSYQELKANSKFFHANTLPLNPKIVSMLKKQASTDLTLLVFLGTWCTDSRNIIPLLFAYLEESKWPIAKKLKLICLDNQKVALNKQEQFLVQSMQITKVPTIIFLRKDQEVTRIVEYGEDKANIKGLPSQTWEKHFTNVLSKN